MSNAIAYLRVSTSEQGDSRLGLEGQHLAITEYASRHGYEITEWREEVASAKGHTLDHRPALREVLALARKRRCRVLVAKLDRLSRDVHFVTGLMAERVAFECVDLGPDVDSFQLHLFAAFAELERKKISERTSVALRAKGYRGQPQNLNQDGNQKRRREAAVDAESYRQTIEPLMELPRWQIAERLEAQRVRSPSGATWTRKSVGKVINRLG